MNDIPKMDPYGALDEQYKKASAVRGCSQEAIHLIADDRPNEAARLLLSVLEGRIDLSRDAASLWEVDNDLS